LNRGTGGGFLDDIAAPKSVTIPKSRNQDIMTYTHSSSFVPPLNVYKYSKTISIYQTHRKAKRLVVAVVLITQSKVTGLSLKHKRCKVTPERTINGME
jgi:hypothetical protein